MYVYILHCTGDTYYTGFTPDLQRRLAAHFSGKGAKYTRSHPPLSLAAAWRCPDDTTARRLEYAMKNRLSHAQKEALIAAPESIGEVFPQFAGVTIYNAE